MRIKIINKINSIPIFFNAIWLVLLCYIFFHQVPEYGNYKPEGASTLIFGTIVVSFFIFFISLIYILIANIYIKHKIYTDMYYVFIPIIFLFSILFFR
jgi:hypothetical protein